MLTRIIAIIIIAIAIIVVIIIVVVNAIINATITAIIIRRVVPNARSGSFVFRLFGRPDYWDLHNMQK